MTAALAGDASNGIVIPADILQSRDSLRGMLVGGAWRHGAGQHYRHVNAANFSLVSDAALASPQDVAEAVSAACDARRDWRRMDPVKRAAHLSRLADLITENGETLAALQTFDTGMPLSGSRTLMPLMVDWTRYYAGWCDKIGGSALTPASGGRAIVNREPYGVVGILLTWNMPISSVCMKAMAALAAGNCVVIKVPEMAPFAMMYFGELIERAGFPAGVVNIFPGGPDAGEALSSDARVGKLSFTGGAATASKILVAAAPNITPTLLELGGKSACILFDDANLDAAIPFAAHFAVAASGQACILPTRLLAQAGIYDQVVARVAEIFAGMRIGNPYQNDTALGPVISRDARERIYNVIDRARTDGAGRLICGGARPAGELAHGGFVQPTLFADVKADSNLFQNEIFGPVLGISRFSTEAEAVDLANGTRLGLYSYLFTRDVSRAWRVADQLEAGSVAINGFTGLSPRSPFGGYGMSGYGKEGGREGLDEFLRSKTIFFAD